MIVALKIVAILVLSVIELTVSMMLCLRIEQAIYNRRLRRARAELRASILRRMR